MVRYREKDYKDQDVSRSRRDTHRSIRKRELKEYISDVLQPELWAQPNDTYFGYSVTSGYFHGPNSTKLLYLASAPQSDAKDGEVSAFVKFSGSILSFSHFLSRFIYSQLSLPGTAH